MALTGGKYCSDICAPTSIGECDHKGILEHVVVEVVVGGKSHDAPPTD